MHALSKKLMQGWSDLHVAAETGDLAKVRQLVQKGTDVNKVSKDKQTALHVASAAGFETVIGELLDRQAKVYVLDENGRTPLHLAAMAGHAKAVAALLGPRNHESPIEKARLLNAKDKDNRDALLLAVQAGHSATVEDLVRSGADVAHSLDVYGRNALHIAAACGHIHLLPLLASRCSLEVRETATGGTPLHMAAEAGQVQAVAWLLQAGAGLNGKDNHGRIPLEAAREADQQATYRMIKDAMTTGRRVSGSGSASSSGGAGAVAGAHGMQQPSGVYSDSPIPAPSASSYGKIVIPDQPPAAVHYPNLPAGATTYY